MIFSPCDLTCGWDGHEHPRGTRVVIDQARQLGANMITYILGRFQLGRFLSTTKVYYEAGAPARDDFVFAQLMHEGDWDPDPSAVHNLLEVRPRQLDAGGEVQAGERAAEGPEGGDLSAAVHDRPPRVRLERPRRRRCCSGT